MTEQAALIAAFRQGLGLSGLAVIQDPQGIRFAPVAHDGASALPTGEMGEVRFWCRHVADAERIAAAANAKLRRLSCAVETLAPPAPREASRPTSSILREADQALIAAAARLHVALHANAEITSDAMAAIARMEEELQVLQRAGELKSVNRSYRIYREDASARGEKIVPYALWFRKYKENLVRQLAAALRYF